YEELADGGVAVDPNARSRVEAICTGDARRSHLVLLVNDVVIVQADDTAHPLPTGTVGMGVAVGGSGGAVAAEFDNFAVREVPR
ncbi:MAG: hypothetical protein LC749_20205, partial [Actinobacteria bacterium]|nr:hypothetical protein [Actinomycetota bacterium]